MSNQLPYTPKQFDLNGLNGISDRTLEMHLKLYEGYVLRDRRQSALGTHEQGAGGPGADPGGRGQTPSGRTDSSF